MKITNYERAQRLAAQNLNRDQMIPALERLTALLNFLQSREGDFVVQTCKNRELIPRESALSEDVVMINGLDPALSEQIEVAQRTSKEQLKAFLQRCIDVIEFFCFIEEEVSVQNRQFADLVR